MIDRCCNDYNECYNNLQHGQHFYAQLSNHVKKMTQAVRDFVMSRSLERAEFLNHLTTPQNAYDSTKPQPIQVPVPRSYELYTKYARPPIAVAWPPVFQELRQIIYVPPRTFTVIPGYPPNFPGNPRGTR